MRPSRSLSLPAFCHYDCATNERCDVEIDAICSRARRPWYHAAECDARRKSAGCIEAAACCRPSRHRHRLPAPRRCASLPSKYTPTRLSLLRSLTGLGCFFEQMAVKELRKMRRRSAKRDRYVARASHARPHVGGDEGHARLPQSAFLSTHGSISISGGLFAIVSSECALGSDARRDL